MNVVFLFVIDKHCLLEFYKLGDTWESNYEIDRKNCIEK
jgi:hypothetical protein